MNRRGFLKGLTAVVGGIALEEAIPLGRVWSFPKEIKISEPLTIRLIRAYHVETDRLITRLDMAYGFGKLDIANSVGIEEAHVFSGRAGKRIALEKCPHLEPHIQVLEHYLETSQAHGHEAAMFGVDLTKHPQFAGDTRPLISRLSLPSAS